MAVYYIATPIEVHDAEAMKDYGPNVGPIVEAFGGKYNLRHGKVTKIAGDWDPGYMVMLEFPSMDQLTEFYESAEYKPWRELREKSVTSSIVVAEEPR